MTEEYNRKGMWKFWIFRYFNFSFADYNSIHISLRANKYSLFSMYYYKGFGWFRIFGIGIKFKNVAKHELVFSERYGRRKYIRIRDWIISIL